MYSQTNHFKCLLLFFYNLHENMYWFQCYLEYKILLLIITQNMLHQKDWYKILSLIIAQNMLHQKDWYKIL